MKKLNLFENRQISLYLNAADKIKYLSKVSKGWNSLIFSGFAWQSLFSTQYDQTWKDVKRTLNHRILLKFKHFRGVNEIYLCSNMINYQFTKLQQCQYDYNQILFDRLNVTKQQVVQVAKQWQMLVKMKDIPFSIKSIHLAAYWNFHKKFEQIFTLIQSKTQLDQIRDQDGKTPLHYAAQNGSVQFAQIVLQKGQTINVVDKYKQTALHYASRSGDLKMVQFLIQKGVNIDAKNLNQFHSLHIALYYSQEQIALQILKVWRFLAGIFSRNKQNMNALHIAANNGLYQVAKALINLGVDTQIYCSKKQTALCLAVQNNHFKITQMLVKNGANINIVTIQYKTPLSIAIQNKNYEIAKILLQNLNRIQQCNTVIRQNPFHTVIQEQNLEFIDLFLKYINDQMLIKQNIDGENVLAIAMRKGSIEIVKRLIQKRPSLIFAKNYNEDSCLHHYTSNPEIIKLLIKQGANIQLCNNDGCTPLHFAIKNNSFDTVSILLKNCKSQSNYINMQNTQGWNAIHYAAINYSITIAKHLLRCVSNLNINACDRHGWTPLHYSSNCQMSELLIENGALVNVFDNQNWTPLHCASMNGNPELVRMLVNRGAKKDCRNYKQLTPIDLAKKQKIREILRN